MPFNLQTFKTRTLTAIVFVIVMLAGLFINFYSFLFLFSIIHFGCWLEYQKLVSIIDPNYKKISLLHKFGFILLGWSLMLCASGSASLASAVNIASIGWWMLITLIIIVPAIDLIHLQQYTFKNLVYSFAGLLYISMSWALMIHLRSRHLPPDNYDLTIPLVLIASIWINDTMAYIVGSLIGKTPLSPISPKKTREGTVGGALLAIVVITLIGHFAFGLPVVHLVIISAIATIMGTIGDLIESKLKRMAGVKDSGEIMPGHGGFLDRFDSLLLAIPFVWLYVYFAV